VVKVKGEGAEVVGPAEARAEEVAEEGAEVGVKVEMEKEAQGEESCRARISLGGSVTSNRTRIPTSSRT